MTNERLTIVAKGGNMKKITLFLVVMVTIFSLWASPAVMAQTFSDNFDDGNADGWLLSPYGIWSIENGALKQASGHDYTMGLAEHFVLSDQIATTQVYSSGGYGGIVLWYKDDRNYICVIIYPGAGGFRVTQLIDGASTTFDYGYPVGNAVWNKLSINANGSTGELGIYFNDTYVFSYQSSIPNRTGLSGVTSGNAVTYFDNFSLNANDIDGDGVNADVDQCPYSDPNTTIMIGTHDTGIQNVLFSNGCKMSDLIAQCFINATSRSKFNSCMNRLPNIWK
jgi:hypothetical protein